MIRIEFRNLSCARSRKLGNQPTSLAAVVMKVTGSRLHPIEAQDQEAKGFRLAKETTLGAHSLVDSSWAIHESSIKADCADTTTGLSCELNSTAL